MADYKVDPGYGIYTDMNAIRADEELGNLHSLYVDQWDWEQVITAEHRTVAFLKDTVSRIYSAMLRTEYMICEVYPQIKPFLAKELHFIHSQELLDMYPDKTAKERENLITKRYGSVFIIGIGSQLSNGEPLEGSLPLSIGGGIGQSRLCMLYLQKGHIGEIQASIWPEDMRQECAKIGMQLI